MQTLRKKHFIKMFVVVGRRQKRRGGGGLQGNTREHKQQQTLGSLRKLEEEEEEEGTNCLGRILQGKISFQDRKKIKKKQKCNHFNEREK